MIFKRGRGRPAVPRARADDAASWAALPPTPGAARRPRHDARRRCASTCCSTTTRPTTATCSPTSCEWRGRALPRGRRCTGRCACALHQRHGAARPGAAPPGPLARDRRRGRRGRGARARRAGSASRGPRRRPRRSAAGPPPPPRTWCSWQSGPQWWARRGRARLGPRHGRPARRRRAAARLAPLRYVLVRSPDYDGAAADAAGSTGGAARGRAVVGRAATAGTYAATAPTCAPTWCSTPGRCRRPPGPPALLQHFRGWFVRTASDAFDPSVAGLMDFRVPQPPRGVAFTYVLPTSPREALVEHTAVQPRRLDGGAVRRRPAATSTAHLPPFEVVAAEQGVIPMTDAPFARGAGPAGLPAGRGRRGHPPVHRLHLLRRAAAGRRRRRAALRGAATRAARRLPAPAPGDGRPAAAGPRRRRTSTGRPSSRGCSTGSRPSACCASWTGARRRRRTWRSCGGAAGPMLRAALPRCGRSSPRRRVLARAGVQRRRPGPPLGRTAPLAASAGCGRLTPVRRPPTHDETSSRRRRARARCWSRGPRALGLDRRAGAASGLGRWRRASSRAAAGCTTRRRGGAVHGGAVRRRRSGVEHASSASATVRAARFATHARCGDCASAGQSRAPARRLTVDASGSRQPPAPPTASDRSRSRLAAARCGRHAVGVRRGRAR